MAPPKRPTAMPRNQDRLTEAEEELLEIAVRLDSALRHMKKHPEQVRQEWYLECIGAELVRAPPSQTAHIT
jgi:hypothetical protein